MVVLGEELFLVSSRVSLHAVSFAALNGHSRSEESDTP